MTDEQKPGRLFLLDGNALLYRSYYAIRNITNSRGMATNAVFGFLSSLRKIEEAFDPEFLAVAFDTKGPTIRHELYKEYKANRKPMPEDLVTQVPILKELIKALNIPILEDPHYEADDILASLADSASEAGCRTVIVSSDKDLFQVVGPLVSQYNPASEIMLDAGGVLRAFGVEPGQVVDVLALWGDPIDNVPGIPGIGEKTAKRLIREHGSLSRLLDQSEKIKNPRIRRLITEHRDRLELSRRLVELRRDLDVSFDPALFSRSEPDLSRLIPLLRDLEFTSLLAEYQQTKENDTRRDTVILDEDGLDKLIREIRRAGRVSLDTETDSPAPTRARLVGMSFAVNPGRAWYLPLRHEYLGAPRQMEAGGALARLRPILTDPAIKKIGQNIKYDFLVLRREGIRLEGIDLDSMLLSYLVEPNWGRHNLDRLALTYLNHRPIAFKDVAGTGKSAVTMDAVDIDKAAPYACEDAELALRLCDTLWPEVEARRLDSLYREIEAPLIELLAEMEEWGVRVDHGVLADLSSELQEDLDRLQRRIYEQSGEEFNLNSPRQLAGILFEKLQLPAGRRTRKTRGFSTSLDVLQELAIRYPIARDVLEFRQLSKLKSTYADALPRLIHPETGRIHTSYNQTVAATGRLSSSDPNLQNIPVRGSWGPRFRRAFIPAPGHLFLSADYSQIELRVLAHLSEDPGLIETFQNDRDVHQETADRVFGEGSTLFEDEPRRRAKIINFSIIYGTSAFSLARELSTTPAEAQKFMDLYFERYPRVREFLDGCVREAEETGSSRTLFGRLRPIPELGQKNRTAHQAGRRIALNTPIQGSAADLIKKAMIDIRKEFRTRGLQARMILQVHDELVFEVREEEYGPVEDIVRKKMESVTPLRVPLKVHLGWGANWNDAK